MAVVIGRKGVGGRSISTPMVIGGAGSGYTWSGTANTPNGSIKLEGAEADIFVQGKSMRVWMDAVEQRLCILEPKPELLDKYQSLKQAYDYYKTLEAILYEQE
jgi:hypothetical protein